MRQLYRDELLKLATALQERSSLPFHFKELKLEQCYDLWEEGYGQLHRSMPNVQISWHGLQEDDRFVPALEWRTRGSRVLSELWIMSERQMRWVREPLIGGRARAIFFPLHSRFRVPS